MKIPFIDYEFTISRKVYFCFFSMILYLIVAMPDTNKFVGKYLNLEKYDDFNENDRYYLWLIHSIVFALLMFVLLMLYSPNPGAGGTVINSLIPKVPNVKVPNVKIPKV